MEITLALILLVLLIALGVVAWVFLKSREDAVRARAELEAMRRGFEEEERQRQAHLEAVREAARAASLEVAQGVSSKLLDDHKREAEATKKASAEQVRETSEALVKQVRGLAETVAGLHARLQEKGETVDTLWRALQSPGGAGALAEIGLANTLKGFGIEEGRDYVLQHATEDAATGRRLRPDAVVFLPAENVLVIDCKASKFLLDIAQAEGGAGEAEAYDNLRRTMNQHLRALADKDYRAAIFAARREAGHGEPPRQVHMMMFLPNDAAMEKLARADTGFRERARAAGIIVGGPDVLHCALSLASVEITLARQVENHEKIVDRTRYLIDGIALALGKAADVGKSIKRAAESFDEFSRSTNRSVLPRARTLVQLGIQPTKPVPPNLPAFTVHAEDRVIEGEAEELEALAPPPRLVK